MFLLPAGYNNIHVLKHATLDAVHATLFAAVWPSGFSGLILFHIYLSHAVRSPFSFLASVFEVQHGGAGSRQPRTQQRGLSG